MTNEPDASAYPPSARLLFWLARRSGIGVHELYSIRATRWLMAVVDRIGPKPSA